MKGASGESNGSRRYDKENLLWQSTVAIKSDPVGPPVAIKSDPVGPLLAPKDRALCYCVLGAPFSHRNAKTALEKLLCIVLAVKAAGRSDFCDGSIGVAEAALDFV